MSTTGHIHSEQSFGASDGPGVRYVLFLQGCPLRCGCCHNPDTWSISGGYEDSPQKVLERVKRCRPFFGRQGGLTVSGGEALLQQEFVTELFSLCKEEGIHTCLDTSGCMITDATPALLAVTDLVLLDIKYTTEQGYLDYVGGGCTLGRVLDFLNLLESLSVPVWLRQVMIPGKNDEEENLRRLADITRGRSFVQKVELLPFRKLCLEKYEALDLPFAFKDIPEPEPERMQQLEQLLQRLL